MSARLLLPNRVGDVRWGYLDKFESNPHLPRSFALSFVLVLGAFAMSPLWPSRSLVSEPRQRYAVVVEVMPLPGTQPAPALRVRPKIKAQVVTGRLNLAVAPLQEAEFGDASSAGLAPEVEGTAIDAGDPGVIAGPAGDVLPWPDPEDFIPVEHDPVLVTMRAPAYPELARDAGLEGTVLVRVLVGEDGFVHRALILQSVLGLDDAALLAARDAVFRPALQQQRPVAVWVVVPIEFRLRD